MVERDAARLRELRLWIGRCADKPSLLLTASPVCGAWQLIFDVVLSEPALQRVVVEARGGDGAWRLLHGRMAIEFRANAARPRSAIRREFSVPVPGPDAELRIAVRGIGRVTLSNVELTDGVTPMRPSGWPAARHRVVGRPAPKDGFPAPDWGRNTGEVALVFGKKKGAPGTGRP
jgi:hypothetical protein